MTNATLAGRSMQRSNQIPTDPAEARALVARAARGDSSAWNEIVVRYGSILHNTVRRYELTAEERDDAIQTIWQKAVEHLHTLRDGAALPGWLATSIRRECLAVIRARAREMPVSSMAEHDNGNRQPEIVDIVISIHEAAALHRSIRELPRQQRAIICALMETPVPTYAEISNRLNMPIGSIGPNRGRALAHLATSLARLRS
jgi:RNA polymerase sigma factor (sigma-70 family)